MGVGERHTDTVAVAGEHETDTSAPVDSSVPSKSELPGRLFAELAPQHTAAMMGVAAALVGLDEAEDAAQDALIKAWRAWNTLRDVSALRSWLLRITVNVCREWHRGAAGTRARLTQPLLDDTAIPDYPAVVAMLAVDPGTSDHTGSLDLRFAVNHLPADYRVVIVLRYYAGLDATEIGAALGIPSPTVRTRLRRGLMALRERLSDDQAQRAVKRGTRV
jgi:RNA polymerase sigma-70 factor (ECF subfamily)